MSLTMLRRKPDRGLGNIHASASAPSRNIDWVLIGGMLGIIAIGYPATAIAGERQRGTLEVLLARPVSRRRR